MLSNFQAFYWKEINHFLRLSLKHKLYCISQIFNTKLSPFQALSLGFKHASAATFLVFKIFLIKLFNKIKT